MKAKSRGVMIVRYVVTHKKKGYRSNCRCFLCRSDREHIQRLAERERIAKEQKEIRDLAKLRRNLRGIQ